VANIKSAKKRIKVAERRKEENRGKKSELATAIKKFRSLVAKQEYTEASTYLKEVFALIDSGASHNRLHKNNASRKKARLSSLLDKAQKAGATTKVVEEVKPEVVKEVKVEVVEEVKKAPVKKTTAAKKETTEKKPTTRKTTKKETA